MLLFMYIHMQCLAFLCLLQGSIECVHRACILAVSIVNLPKVDVIFVHLEVSNSSGLLLLFS